MQDNEKKPALRFKGFTDPWEQRKISELAEKTYGGGTPTTSNEAFWNGNIPWIQSSDIVDGKLIGVEPRKYITQTGLNSSATQLVPKNSIAIITRVGVGKLAYMPFSYSTSQDFLSLSKLNTEPFFTVYACYKKLQSELNTVQGTSIKGITKDELLAKTISVPVYSEQKQIGSFFAQLDTLITLHQRKYEKLVNIKKSMLDKMFPPNGASVPEIRFKGFTDPWEQRKLENLASFGGGHTPSMADASNYVDGKILWVTSQDVKQHYIENTTTMISEKGAATLTLYPSDSIVIVARSGILRHTIPVAKLRKPATVNQDIKVIQTVDSCDSSWLLQYFIASNKTLLREYGKTGTTVESIDFAKMKSTALMVPYIEEQQAIGSFFSRLDNLITLHQRKRLWFAK